MKTYPWNKEVTKRAFWDPNADEGGSEVFSSSTLKDGLKNIYQRSYEDVLLDCSRALVMIMEHIEQTEVKEK